MRLSTKAIYSNSKKKGKKKSKDPIKNLHPVIQVVFGLSEVLVLTLNLAVIILSEISKGINLILSSKKKPKLVKEKSNVIYFSKYKKTE